MRKLLLLAMPVTMIMLFGARAEAQQAFAGSWKIARTLPGPWADPAKGNAPDDDTKRLIGKTITFAAKSVTGPAEFACRNPHYEIRKADRPDMLFQGSLAEPDYAGKTHDPATLARSLGMSTPTIPTLGYSCSEMEFHMLNSNELMFGLNDHVYLLDRIGKN